MLKILKQTKISNVNQCSHMPVLCKGVHSNDQSYDSQVHLQFQTLDHKHNTCR